MQRALLFRTCHEDVTTNKKKNERQAFEANRAM